MEQSSRNTNLTYLSCKMQLEIWTLHAIWAFSLVTSSVETIQNRDNWISEIIHSLCMLREIFQLRVYLSRVRRCELLKLSRVTWSAEWAVRRPQTQFNKSNHRCHARKRVDQNVITNNCSRWETNGEGGKSSKQLCFLFNQRDFLPSKAIRQTSTAFVTS